MRPLLYLPTAQADQGTTHILIFKTLQTIGPPSVDQPKKTRCRCMKNHHDPLLFIDHINKMHCISSQKFFGSSEGRKKKVAKGIRRERSPSSVEVVGSS